MWLQFLAHERMKWRNCRLAIYVLYPKYYVTVKVLKIFSTYNENCIYGYLAACTEPKWPNQVGSRDLVVSVQFLHFILSCTMQWGEIMSDAL